MSMENCVVLEITTFWPAEVFIQRHYQTMLEGGYPVEILSKSTIGKRLLPASVTNISKTIKAEIMPDFADMSPFNKLFSLKYITWTSIHFQKLIEISKSVMMGYVQRKHPKLIHFHSLSIATRLSWLPIHLGIPYTISVRGSDIQVKPLMGPVDEIILTLEYAAGLHVVAGKLGEEVCNLINKRINYKVIFTVIPEKAFIFTRNYERGNAKHKINFLSIGRLHWTKGFPSLLKAIKDLRNIGLDAKLTLIGSGIDEGRIRYWMKHLNLENEIFLTGKLGEEEILAYLQSCDAYVQSSVAEGFSNALAEAMACSCPVFATNVGGTSEIITHGENGFLLDPFRPETWAKELSKATNEDEMKQIGMRGYETARDKFLPEVHYCEFSRFYDLILNEWTGYKKKSSGQPETNARKLNGIDENNTNILILGNWKWQTGADLLLYAISRAKQSLDIGRIVFWGQGEQEDELRYLTKVLNLNSCVKIANSDLVKKPVNVSWFILTLLDDEWLIEYANGDVHHAEKDEHQMTENLEEFFLKKTNLGKISY